MRLQHMLVWVGVLTMTISASETEAQESPSLDTGQVEVVRDGVGFHLGIPAYLFSRFSVFGLQSGVQLRKAKIRLDASFINEIGVDEETWIAIPSFGLFFTHDHKSNFRLYEGATAGVEVGIGKAYHGWSVLINVLAGLELLASNKNTFFFEIGSAFTTRPIAEGFNGGTTIGGGLNYYLTKPEKKRHRRRGSKSIPATREKDIRYGKARDFRNGLRDYHGGTARGEQRGYPD